MGGACSMNGRNGKFIQNFYWKNLKGRDNLEDVSVDGRIILKWILEKKCANVWIRCIWMRIGTSGGLL
jgi:hypothetical protein